MAWNGSGSTVCENAVLESPSLAQPSTSSRKSRFQPAGSARQTAGRKQQPQLVARSHDHQAVVHRFEQRPHIAVARVQCPASDSTSRPASTSGNRTPPAACAADRWSASRIRGNADRPDAASTGVMRDCGARVLFAQKNLVPIHAEIGDDAHLARADSHLPAQIHRDGLRLAGGNAHVLDHGLPVARRVLHLQIGEDQAALRFLRGARRKVLPSAQSTQPFRISTAWFVARRAAEIEIEVCSSATPV